MSPREGVKAKTAEKVPGEFTYHFGLWSRIFGINKDFQPDSEIHEKDFSFMPTFPKSLNYETQKEQQNLINEKSIRKYTEISSKN